jgi:hypothetical protein
LDEEVVGRLMEIILNGGSQMVGPTQRENSSSRQLLPLTGNMISGEEHHKQTEARVYHVDGVKKYGVRSSE